MYENKVVRKIVFKVSKNRMKIKSMIVQFKTQCKQ